MCLLKSNPEVVCSICSVYHRYTSHYEVTLISCHWFPKWWSFSSFMIIRVLQMVFLSCFRVSGEHRRWHGAGTAPLQLSNGDAQEPRDSYACGQEVYGDWEQWRSGEMVTLVNMQNNESDSDCIFTLYTIGAQLWPMTSLRSRGPHFLIQLTCLSSNPEDFY